MRRIFPYHSPPIAKIEVVRRGAVRRAKIYYLSKLKGKSARIKERRMPGAVGKGKGRVKAKAAVAPAPSPSPSPAPVVAAKAPDAPAAE
jgi:hypothetical protein